MRSAADSIGPLRLDGDIHPYGLRAAGVRSLGRFGGELAVMELELIEPELFFRLNPPAADALADEVATALRA